MEFIFSVFKWLGIAFVVLIVLAIFFGKRVRKKWEYEAEFRNETGREIGEFEVEMSKIEKDEADFSLKVEFHLRHEAIATAGTVQVFVDDLLVLEGRAARDGYVRLGMNDLQNAVDEPLSGKQARVVADGREIVSETLVRD